MTATAGQEGRRGVCEKPSEQLVAGGESSVMNEMAGKTYVTKTSMLKQASAINIHKTQLPFRDRKFSLEQRRDGAGAHETSWKSRLGPAGLVLERVWAAEWWSNLTAHPCPGTSEAGRDPALSAHDEVKWETIINC